ncbi:MAG: hypothetical protein KFB93_08880 [Simkaniaceae bacterium]|nr:MAG: hypothetical protein KFB93_08880 [Simkaniaceae bacterium]
MEVGVEMGTQVSRVEGHRSLYSEMWLQDKADKGVFELPSAVSSCSESLRPALVKIQSFFPELLRVMHGVLGEPVQILLVKENFSARWDFGAKEILIGEDNFSQNPHYGPILDLLFEMQNACYTNLFIEAKKAATKLSVEEYVREVERVEWSTCHLTCARLESLSERDFPRAANDFQNTYFEDQELYYLHQQASGHSFTIADRYQMISGTKDRTPFQGTWKLPLAKDGLSREALYELLGHHLTVIRTGEDEDVLLEKIGLVEQYARSGAKWAQETLVNLKWFSEKFEASSHFSNVEVPLYKPDRNKLKFLGIVD